MEYPIECWEWGGQYSGISAYNINFEYSLLLRVLKGRMISLCCRTREDCSPLKHLHPNPDDPLSSDVCKRYRHGRPEQVFNDASGKHTPAWAGIVEKRNHFGIHDDTACSCQESIRHNTTLTDIRLQVIQKEETNFYLYLFVFLFDNQNGVKKKKRMW